MAYNTIAYNPANSVFVAANAGAGKTSLLVGRVLGLLLGGVEPSKILCLTFTNAAAAEMQGRIQKELGAWVMADDASLCASLYKLIGKEPEAVVMKQARGLFAKVLESPEGVRIQTIHGFAQSLLKRFPLEAGVNPHFSVMDSRTEQELLSEARTRLFMRAQTEDPKLQQALAAIAQMASEMSFHGLVAQLINHKRRLRALFAEYDGVEQAIHKVWQLLQVKKSDTLQSLIATHFVYDADTLVKLRAAVALLFKGDDKEQATGRGIAAWLEAPGEAGCEDYLITMLTQKGGIRKTLFKKNTITDEALIEALAEEQQRVWRFNDVKKALAVAHRTTHVLHVADALLALYDSLKNARAQMDYDDLILSACRLLARPGIAPWVLYKLDGGIDHILVDEAQDTSPEQWQIVGALTEEFFAGKGCKDWERSLFVVGDEKQSIYSFQGADPAELGKRQAYFTKRIQDAGKPVERMALKESFRSTKEVLAAVDAIFARGPAKEGLMFDDAALEHIPTRLAHPGVVELWPLVEAEEDSPVSHTTLLVRRIADTIRDWLKDGKAEAGDIMILVRNRTTLVDRLVRALKKRGVPVAGQDRMQLDDNLAVQDLMALGQCVLLPEDDLTLAAVLKSPIFNLSEDELYTLAHGREGSLWERLKGHAKAYALLTDLRAKADFVSPFELYSYLLDTLGARRRIIGRMGAEYNEPIDEFLGQALLYERGHPPSLQGFLHWLNSSDSEIKRDMEEAGNSVRIMTVHGAKGLQAPIVILPDTVEAPKLKDSLLWHEEDVYALPFWPGAAENDDAFCAGLRDAHKQAMFAEYRRLLYVALTRAADRLYVCGATSREKVNEQSWYTLVRDGLAPVAKPFETPWGEGLRLGAEPASCEAFAKSTPLLRAARTEKLPAFDFLNQPAPVEPAPPQPLVPSRLEGDEPSTASPLAPGRFYQRGNLIHALLQYLPDIHVNERKQAVQRIAMGYAKSLTPELVQEAVREALAVMEDPEFAFLFAEGSLAEVPVTGVVEMAGKPVAVAGQIDRLYVGEKDVWIVDFKSNRLPPAKTPAPYVRQMQLYRLLLARIYPGKTVRCALLWTAAPKLSVLPEESLDEAMVTTYI